MSAVITSQVQVPGVGAEDTTWRSGECATLEEVLEPLDIVQIHQHLDVVEVCLGWERNNRYSIYNRNGEQVLYVYEAAQCYARQCYGSLREFTLIVTDNDDNRLLYLQRPLRCSSRCFYSCCCLQEMSIYKPPDVLLAMVRERHEVHTFLVMDYSDGNRHGRLFEDRKSYPVNLWMCFTRGL